MKRNPAPSRWVTVKDAESMDGVHGVSKVGEYSRLVFLVDCL